MLINVIVVKYYYYFENIMVTWEGWNSILEELYQSCAHKLIHMKL